MNRPSLLLWFVLIVLILLPTAAGRILLDLASGLLVLALALPLLLTGIGWLGWRYLQSRLIKCQSCGANILSNTIQCPVCGSPIKSTTQDSEGKSSIPASSVTIDITAEEADKEI